MSQIRCWRGIVLFFKCTFSVLNHLAAFGGYFFYSSERFCRNALMCSIILASSAWEESVIVPLFQRPSVGCFFLFCFFSIHNRLGLFVSIYCFFFFLQYVFLRAFAAREDFLTYFWAKLSLSPEVKSARESSRPWVNSAWVNSAWCRFHCNL